MQILWKILDASLATFLLAAPWILLGLIAAGVLHVAIARERVERWMGGRGMGSVVRAALFGVPLPVCSCGVVPLSIALRKQGASRPASMSFLITTPESGPDSILLTWGLLGPVMALVRPVASFLTAVTAGALAILFPGRADAGVPVLPAGACCADPCCGADHDAPATPTLRTRARRAAQFSFVTLLDDIAFWLVIGVLLTGVIAATFPPDLAVWGLGGGLLPMLLILVAAVPMYICASASTPVAAALVAKGISPGAALVFLLAGPATNAASVLVLTRNFGRAFIRSYLLGISIGAVGSGLLLDALLVRFGLDIVSRLPASASEELGVLHVSTGLALAALIGWRFSRGALRESLRELRDQFLMAGTGHAQEHAATVEPADPGAAARPAPADATPAIEIHDLWLSREGRPILEGINLTVRRESFLGIIGPNGGGKTMLLKVILGLERADRGTVRVLGRSPDEAQGSVAYVPQFSGFDPSFPIRVIDVTLMGRLGRGRLLRPFRRADRERARQSLERLDVGHLAGRQIGTLSGGQLQRVLIARALTMESRLLLLDEPVASLDQQIGGQLYELLAELSSSMTVVLVDHDIGVLSRYVKSVACLNRRLHYHESGRVSREMLEETYGHPVGVVSHDHPAPPRDRQRR